MLAKPFTKLSMVAVLVAGALFAGSISAVNAQVSTLEQRESLKQELEVMNSIFETKLQHMAGEKAQERSRWQRHRLNYDYLAGQGVVYRVNFGRGFHFEFDFDMPVPAELPSAGLKVGEQIRVIQEQRRVVRELEYSRNSADKSEQANIDKELATAREKLAEARAQLNEQKEQLRAASSEFRDLHQQQRSQREQKIAKQVTEFEKTLAATLCQYGTTLKSLPSNEHVSFVLQGAGVQEAGGRDKIYIFSQKQLSDCEKNDGASDLLSNSLTYSF